MRRGVACHCTRGPCTLLCHVHARTRRSPCERRHSCCQLRGSTSRRAKPMSSLGRCTQQRACSSLQGEGRVACCVGKRKPKPGISPQPLHSVSPPRPHTHPSSSCARMWQQSSIPSSSLHSRLNPPCMGAGQRRAEEAETAVRQRTKRASIWWAGRGNMQLAGTQGWRAPSPGCREACRSGLAVPHAPAAPPARRAPPCRCRRPAQMEATAAADRAAAMK